MKILLKKNKSIISLLEMGYKSKVIGDLFNFTARTGNVELFNKVTSSIVSYLAENNKSLENLGVDKQTYGIMKTLLAREVDPLRRKEEVTKVFAFLNDQNNANVKSAQARWTYWW